jgi:hypothetical protein
LSIYLAVTMHPGKSILVET